MVKKILTIVCVVAFSTATSAYAGPAWGVVRDKVPDQMNFCLIDMPSFGPMTSVPCWADGAF